MHKDYLAAAWQNDVGPSRQVFAVKSKAVPKLVQQATYDMLGLSVTRSYGGHIPTSRSGTSVKFGRANSADLRGCIGGDHRLVIREGHFPQNSP